LFPIVTVMSGSVMTSGAVALSIVIGVAVIDPATAFAQSNAATDATSAPI
jgi:hypothetical protein